jgi:hypothetical protein
MSGRRTDDRLNPHSFSAVRSLGAVDVSRIGYCNGLRCLIIFFLLVGCFNVPNKACPNTGQNKGSSVLVTCSTLS